MGLRTLFLLAAICLTGLSQAPNGNVWVNQVAYELNFDFYPNNSWGGVWYMDIYYNDEFNVVIPWYSNESIVIDMSGYYFYGFALVNFYYMDSIGNLTLSNSDFVFF